LHLRSLRIITYEDEPQIHGEENSEKLIYALLIS